MLARILLPFIFSLAASVFATPDPTEPGPGQVFKEGGSCHLAWNADTTGTWKATTILLRTGDNLNMVTLTTVATGIDTTKAGVYDWPCPTVSPHAPIYFYEFSSTASTDKTWTTRFTIADAAGTTDPAPNQAQPDGQAIPWGVGAIASGAFSSAAVSSSAPASSVSSSAASSSASSSAASSSVSSASSSVSSDAPSSSVSQASSKPLNTRTTSVVGSSPASTPSTSPGVNTANNGALTLALAPSLGAGALALAGALSLL